MFMRHLTNPFAMLQATQSHDMKQLDHIMNNSVGLTVGIEVEKDTVYYAFANCCPTDQFNRKIGHEIVVERLAARIPVPAEVTQMLFIKNCESIDYTIINPQLILDIVIPFVIRKHI